MTTETLPLNAIAALALLIPPSFSSVASPSGSATTALELSPKKPSYGYDDEDSEDDDDAYDDEDEENDKEDDEESDDDGDDDESSYDDEDDDYDEDEDEDEEDDDDDDEDEDDDDIGYYTSPLNSASERQQLHSPFIA